MLLERSSPKQFEQRLQHLSARTNFALAGLVSHSFTHRRVRPASRSGRFCPKRSRCRTCTLLGRSVQLRRKPREFRIRPVTIERIVVLSAIGFDEHESSKPQQAKGANKRGRAHFVSFSHRQFHDRAGSGGLGKRRAYPARPSRCHLTNSDAAAVKNGYSGRLRRGGRGQADGRSRWPR